MFIKIKTYYGKHDKDFSEKEIVVNADSIINVLPMGDKECMLLMKYNFTEIENMFGSQDEIPCLESVNDIFNKINGIKECSQEDTQEEVRFCATCGCVSDNCICKDDLKCHLCYNDLIINGKKAYNKNLGDCCDDCVAKHNGNMDHFRRVKG